MSQQKVIKAVTSTAAKVAKVVKVATKPKAAPQFVKRKLKPLVTKAPTQNARRPVKKALSDDGAQLLKRQELNKDAKRIARKMLGSRDLTYQDVIAGRIAAKQHKAWSHAVTILKKQREKRVEYLQKARYQKPNARTAARVENLGRYIYIYRQIYTNQIVYSLQPTMNNREALKQLTFVGKKSVPAAIRKDMWTPMATVRFNSKKYGLLAYHHLREYKRRHETEYDPKILTTTSRKERRDKLMDQKANSIADLAAVMDRAQASADSIWEDRTAKAQAEYLEALADIRQREEQTLRTENPEFTEDQVKEKLEEVLSKLEHSPPVVDRVKNLVHIFWSDLHDAEYAKSWPEVVTHHIAPVRASHTPLDPERILKEEGYRLKSHNDLRKEKTAKRLIMEKREARREARLQARQRREAKEKRDKMRAEARKRMAAEAPKRHISSQEIRDEKRRKKNAEREARRKALAEKNPSERTEAEEAELRTLTAQAQKFADERLKRKELKAQEKLKALEKINHLELTDKEEFKLSELREWAEKRLQSQQEGSPLAVPPNLDTKPPPEVKGGPRFIRELALRHYLKRVKAAKAKYTELREMDEQELDPNQMSVLQALEQWLENRKRRKELGMSPRLPPNLSTGAPDVMSPIMAQGLLRPEHILAIPRLRRKESKAEEKLKFLEDKPASQRTPTESEKLKELKEWAAERLNRETTGALPKLPPSLDTHVPTTQSPSSRKAQKTRWEARLEAKKLQRKALTARAKLMTLQRVPRKLRTETQRAKLRELRGWIKQHANQVRRNKTPLAPPDLYSGRSRIDLREQFKKVEVEARKSMLRDLKVRKDVRRHEAQTHTQRKREYERINEEFGRIGAEISELEAVEPGSDLLETLKNKRAGLEGEQKRLWLLIGPREEVKRFRALREKKRAAQRKELSLKKKGLRKLKLESATNQR